MDRILRQFLAVAETGNVTLAAKALHVSQPTISVNIQKLEEQHQVPLFKRSSQGLTLTESGRILYEHARIMARIERNANWEIQALRSSSKKALKIGCGYAWWSVFMRSVITDYRAGCPGVSVLIDITSSLDGLRNLISGDTSLFFGTKVEHISSGIGVEFEELFTMKDGHFVRQGHPLTSAESDPGRLDDFERLDVVPIVNSHLGILDNQANQAFGLTPGRGESAVLSTNSMSVCIDLLHDSDAILYYPEITREFFEQQGIVMLNVEGSSPHFPIGIYTLKERAEDAELIDFKRAILQTINAVSELSNEN